MPPRYRTVIFLGCLAVDLYLGLRFCAAIEDRETARSLFSSFSSALCWFAAIAASKSSIQHLAGGGGVRGALRSLLADDKPATPPEAKP